MRGQDQVSGIIPTRSLGRTGVQVSILGVGGYHVGAAGSQLGVRIVREAIDAHFHSFQRTVIPKLRERGIGIIGMKSLCSGHLLKTGVSPRDAISYSLSQPIDVLVSGMDSLEVLQRNLDMVRSFEPMSEARQKELLAQAGPHATKGHLERYK